MHRPVRRAKDQNASDHRYNDYRDYFMRTERRLSRDELRLYSTPIAVGGSNGDDVKLNQLYRDCFGSHLTNCLGASVALQVSNQKDRLVPSDNISRRFLEKYYKPPFVVEAGEDAGTPEHYAKTQLSVDEFLDSISTNPIVGCDPHLVEIGSNKISYLIGDVGTGKSIYLCRLVLEAQKRGPDVDGYTLVPIFYDFESRHRDGVKLKPIDTVFWARLYALICDTISNRQELSERAELDTISISALGPNDEPCPNIEHYICKLSHDLAERKIRLLFIFDNLDRYHFRYTEYSLFGKYADSQMESVQSNITRLVTTFSRNDLWKAGFCALFVCRQYLYDYIFQYGDVEPVDNNFGVYRIAPTPAQEVVSSRFRLYEEVVNFVSVSLAQGKVAALQTFIEPLRTAMALRKVGEQVQRDGDAIATLASIGHNGHRSLVKFLSSLSLKCTDVEVCDRLISKQPRLLMLLYICNNKHRYSQSQNHFPNIFLNDCMVGTSLEFPEAHRTHLHSYWLKYLILKYIAVQEDRGEHVTCQEIIDLFSGVGRYERHLVQYMLGSLCTTTEFSCLYIGYGGAQNIQDCRLYMTDRGRFLVTHDIRLPASEPVEFCFEFDYLQLAIDDRLLALPKRVYDSIFKPTDYRYLYYSDADYNTVVARTVFVKLEAVLNFVHVLITWYSVEHRRNISLFKRLSDLGIQVKGETIRRNILNSAANLLKVMPRTGMYEHLTELDTFMENNSEITKSAVALRDDVLRVQI